MIEIVKGDFFDYDADIRVNTVNCVGIMGAGVALLFKRKFPDMYDEYVKECKQGRLKIGLPHVWKDSKTLKTSVTIINFPTKDHWKNPSEYEFVEKGLLWLRQYLAEKGKVTITLPALGCGHGGLKWERVKEMIFEKLDNLDAKVLLFEPTSSVKKEISSETLAELKEKNIYRITPNDESYPIKLKGKSAVEIYVKGNIEVFNKKILSIVVDTKANERERASVLKCLDALTDDEIVYLLGYNSSFEIDLVKYVLTKKASVILMIPFGIFNLKIRKDLTPLWDEKKITVISIAQPYQSWKINESVNALKFRFKISNAILIANYDYNILKKYESELTESKNEIFYINYWTSEIQFYTRINAKQIGRDRETLLPNMNPILDTLQYKTAFK
jgi:O-acetyl-ADP-ribose deacetylase (regulator of RNase III)